MKLRHPVESALSPAYAITLELSVMEVLLAVNERPKGPPTFSQATERF